MTDLLKRAFDAASKLPPSDQDALAAAILAKVAVDGLWDASFARQPAALERLADEALTEHRLGRNQSPRPRSALTSHTTERFRKAFAGLPAQVQQQAR
ncbi:MAG: hypothetical protein M3477_05855 [Gemmatimonadota bacterium]|nr:hypothetical protein [Gemmatimonadota bacterium]